MKRLFCLLISCLCGLSLCACGGKVPVDEIAQTTAVEELNLFEHPGVILSNMEKFHVDAEWVTTVASVDSGNGYVKVMDCVFNSKTKECYCYWSPDEVCVAGEDGYEIMEQYIVDDGDDYVTYLQVTSYDENSQQKEIELSRGVGWGYKYLSRGLGMGIYLAPMMLDLERGIDLRPQSEMYGDIECYVFGTEYEDGSWLKLYVAVEDCRAIAYITSASDVRQQFEFFYDAKSIVVPEKFFGDIEVIDANDMVSSNNIHDAANAMISEFNYDGLGAFSHVLENEIGLKPGNNATFVLEDNMVKHGYALNLKYASSKDILGGEVTPGGKIEYSVEFDDGNTMYVAIQNLSDVVQKEEDCTIVSVSTNMIHCGGMISANELTVRDLRALFGDNYCKNAQNELSSFVWYDGDIAIVFWCDNNMNISVQPWFELTLSELVGFTY